MPSFDVQLLLHGEAHDWLLHGLVVSLELTAVSLLFALPLGVVVAVLRAAPVKALRAIGTLYVEVIRNVPLLAHLLFWYFGAPQLLPEPVKSWLMASNTEFISAVIALSLYVAAYIAEDFRSGLRAVPTVQFEAGRALGLSYTATLRKVILPQALPVTVPPLLSQVLNLWKDSSLATVIGVGEMMYQAARVESATFRSTEAFLFVTLAYGLVSLALTAAVTLSQRRSSTRSTIWLSDA